MSSRDRNARERAAAEWATGRQPEIVRSSRQLDAEECDRIWGGLRDARRVAWFGWWVVPSDPRAPERKWRGQLASARKRLRGEWPSTTETFRSDAFDPDEDGTLGELLRMALVTRGVSRVYELRETEGFSHEIDAGAIDVTPRWGGEGVWTDDTFEWVVYVDHDEAVTVSGDWLVPDLKEAWPAWRDSLYEA